MMEPVPAPRWIPRALPRAARRLAPFVLLGFAAVLAACSSEGARQGVGGMPAALAARVSLVVAQTRSQFPELSGADIPFDAVTPPDASSAGEPELALRGGGESVQPGLQLGAHQRVQAALYLDKRAYASGYLELTPEGKPAERWAIVASDRRGAAAKDFSFSYVLTGPENQLRYLVLIGGRYTKDGVESLGYEGTLIQPGTANDLERWTRAFKLNFGYRLPVLPPHQVEVEQAVKLFGELGRMMAHLDRLREGISAAEGDLATLRNAGGPAEGAASGPGSAPTGAPAPGPRPATAAAETPAQRERRIADAQARLDAQRAERDALLGETEVAFVRYYGLRQAIAKDYAAFTEGNRYLWLNQEGRQDFYDRWKVVEFHHPRIDDLVSEFLAYQPQGGKVLDARKAAMAAITQQDNWAKDPSRSGKTRPR